jgi:hypothetical protein
MNSCNSPRTEETKENTKSIESSVSDEKVVEEQKTDTVKPKSEIVKKELQLFNIGDIPSNWIRLTKTDSIPIIYSTCDGGNRLISILKKDGGFNLLMHGQQEDYEYTVKDVRINESGIILITATWISSTDEQEFKFTWIDIENGLGKWETTFEPNFHHVDEFVSKEFEQNFPAIEQPCIECWGEEECDLMEKNKSE